MRSRLLAVSAIGLSPRMFRRVIIGMMAAVLLSLTSAGVASAQAQTQRTVTREPVDDTGQLICTSGEQRITGVYETVVQTTQDAAGGFTVVTRTTYENFTAVDLVTGQQYLIIGSPFGNTFTHVGADGFPAITTSVTTAQVTAQGQPNPGVGGEIQIVTHTTVNANGEVVVSHDMLNEHCHG
jgi:hypothetical protein